MATKLLSTLLLILLVACNTGQDTKAVSDTTGTKDTPKLITQALEATDNSKQRDASNLLGMWTDGNSENASFDIREDSIYYVDQFATYKYTLIGDSIRIFYPDWRFTGAVRFNNDTLLISSNDGTTKYWKFVN